MWEVAVRLVPDQEHVDHIGLGLLLFTIKTFIANVRNLGSQVRRGFSSTTQPRKGKSHVLEHSQCPQTCRPLGRCSAHPVAGSPG